MNEVLIITESSWKYMTSVPLFWATMGFTTAISMLIVPLLFDGDMKLVLKALWAKVLYILMLLWINLSQIVDIRLNRPHILTPMVKSLSYVTALNIIAVSLAWFFGFILGCIIIRIKYKHKLHKF